MHLTIVNNFHKIQISFSLLFAITFWETARLVLFKIGIPVLFVVYTRGVSTLWSDEGYYPDYRLLMSKSDGRDEVTAK